MAGCQYLLDFRTSPDETTESLETVFEFTIFGAREFLTCNYSLEKH